MPSRDGVSRRTGWSRDATSSANGRPGTGLAGTVTIGDADGDAGSTEARGVDGATDGPSGDLVAVQDDAAAKANVRTRVISRAGRRCTLGASCRRASGGIGWRGGTVRP